jgi:putative lipoic acid-binding regulatory protein
MTDFAKTINPQDQKKPEINYPCSWVYKVIGEDCSLLKDAILSSCSPIEVQISHSHSSSKGKYHSLNAELVVPDEPTRLKIYEQLHNNSAVKYVL